jgi:hypothetical protein
MTWRNEANSDLLLDIPRGSISSLDHILKFGKVILAASATPEDVWDGGGDYPWPTVAQIHDIVSTDADDDFVGASGNGARTVEIFGLDANYDQISETVTMNGQLDVPTTRSYLRINRMVVRTAGDTGSNEGTITATGQTDATVTSQITIGNNQTLQAIYTIPNNRIGYMTHYYSAMDRNVTTGAADIQLFIRPQSEVFQLKHIIGTIAAGASYFHHDFGVYLQVLAKSDIKIRAAVTANNTHISAGFDIILHKTG